MVRKKKPALLRVFFQSYVVDYFIFEVVSVIFMLFAESIIVLEVSGANKVEVSAETFVPKESVVVVVSELSPQAVRKPATRIKANNFFICYNFFSRESTG